MGKRVTRDIRAAEATGGRKESLETRDYLEKMVILVVQGRKVIEVIREPRVIEENKGAEGTLGMWDFRVQEDLRENLVKTGMTVNLDTGGPRDRGEIREFLDNPVSQDKMVILGCPDCPEDLGAARKFAVVLVSFNCVIFHRILKNDFFKKNVCFTKSII